MVINTVWSIWKTSNHEGKFSFAVTEGFKEKHGNTIDYKRHEALQGKTIKKVTYLVKDGADIVINTNLKCKTLACIRQY